MTLVVEDPSGVVDVSWRWYRSHEPFGTDGLQALGRSGAAFSLRLGPFTAEDLGGLAYRHLTPVFRLTDGTGNTHWIRVGGMLLSPDCTRTATGPVAFVPPANFRYADGYGLPGPINLMEVYDPCRVDPYRC